MTEIEKAADFLASFAIVTIVVSAMTKGNPEDSKKLLADTIGDELRKAYVAGAEAALAQKEWNA